MFQKLPKLVLALAVATACTGVFAKELRMASGVPPVHPGHDPLYTELQKELPEVSGGKLTGKLLGTEVISLSKMRTGMTSKLVDVGLFLPAYFPADLPEINLVGDMAFLSKNPQAMAAAVTEYIVNCVDCQAELKKLGVTYINSHSTDAYHILSSKPVATLEDLKGLRLRVGGPQYARWAEAMGATPSRTPVGETFEALSQGVLDGTIASSADIVSFRLEDIIKHVNTASLGTFFSDISHTVGIETWKGLSEDERKMLVKASTKANARTTQRWVDISAKGENIVKEKGMTVSEPDQALLDATAAFVEKDLAEAARMAAEENGIKNAEEKLAKFRELIDKWTKIAEENDNDVEKMAEAVQAEIWDKVDYSTYGL
ncbi:MAG: C4-dicarboxylate TRAP transporter substrate-binding protein [Thiolinea sp.]